MNKIHWFAEDINFSLPYPTITADWIKQVVQDENHILFQLNVIFCSDRYLHAHNLLYLQHDTFTDVITFDYSDQHSLLEGDVYISVERVKENALARRQHWVQELHTVLVHGVLHLLHYADNTPEARAQMRQKETTYTRQLLLSYPEQLEPPSSTEEAADSPKK